MADTVESSCPYCGKSVSATAPPGGEGEVTAACANCGNNVVINFTPEEPAAKEEITAEDQKSAQKLLAEGRKHAKENDFEQACMKLRAASDKSPENIEILKALADACSKNNQSYEALAAYTKILGVDPAHEEALFKTGMLFVQQKRYGQGVISLEKLLEQNPAASQAQLMINIARENQKEAEREAKERQKQRKAASASSGETDFYNRLGKLFPPPEGYSWIGAAFWIGGPVAIMFAHSTFSGDQNAVKWLLISIMVYAVLLSVVVHEYGHGLAAYLQGDDTAFDSGRLTLNPFKHVSIIGMGAVPAFVYWAAGVMFGWAKPVPFNPVKLSSWPRGQAVTAGAGPVASFILSYCAFTLFLVLAAWHNGAHPGSNVIFTVDLSRAFETGGGNMAAAIWFVVLEASAMVCVISLIIGVFNLVPVAPLDGAWLLASVASPSLAGLIRKSLLPGVAVIGAAVYFGWMGVLLYPIYVVLTGYYFISSLVL